MAYAIADIITWSKMCEPLARIAQSKEQSSINGSIDNDLDIWIYLTRKDVEYFYAQDPTNVNCYQAANFLYSLCTPFVFTAQATTGSGGSISPITPSLIPDPYDFVVSSSSYIVTGATSKVITNFAGFNILFVRNSITQSVVNDGTNTCFLWDRSSGTLTIINGAVGAGELIQIYPLV